MPYHRDPNPTPRQSWAATFTIIDWLCAIYLFFCLVLISFGVGAYIVWLAKGNS